MRVVGAGLCPAGKATNKSIIVSAIRISNYTCMHGWYYSTTGRKERKQQELTGIEGRSWVLIAGELENGENGHRNSVTA